MERCLFICNSHNQTSTLWKVAIVLLKYLPTPTSGWYKHGFRCAADWECGDKGQNPRSGWLRKDPEIEPYKNCSKFVNCRNLC